MNNLKILVRSMFVRVVDPDGVDLDPILTTRTIIGSEFGCQTKKIGPGFDTLKTIQTTRIRI